MFDVARVDPEPLDRRPVVPADEPVIFHKYAIDIADACHEKGIKAVAVSAGYVCPEPRKELYARIDAANIDLKAFTERFYRKLTGSSLEPVLDTIRYLRFETDVWFELTTLVIPGENDSDEEITRLVEWVRDEIGVDVPLHFTTFHPDFKMLDYPPKPPETLSRARRIALDNGIRYAYTGNTRDKNGQSTYCHHCGERLIGREWYQLSEWNMDDTGHCLNCGTRCSGVFAGPPGHWGRRRQPVWLASAR